MSRIVLVRHTEISPRWAGRCYGRSDVPLSVPGRQAARGVAERLALTPQTVLVSSPARRARFLAGLIARHIGVPVEIEPRLSECDFGSWEGQTWDGIYAQTGDAMMGLITAPDTFRPGGGETTFTLRARAMEWLKSAARLERDIVAVCHGGPIAAIRGTLSGAAVERWPGLVPSYGEVIEIDRAALTALLA